MSDRPREHRSAAAVLADWRDAERRVEDEPSGTPAWQQAQREAGALAVEYHAVIAELTNGADDSPATPPVTSSLAARDPG